MATIAQALLETVSAGNTKVMTKQSEPWTGGLPREGDVPVLLTRPEATATVFGQSLAKRFPGRIRAILAPLMQPEFLAPSLPADLRESHAGVIFTSATAVAAAVRLGLTSGPAFCVGKQTAAQAKAAGFDAVSADGDAGVLVALVAARRPTGPLLHLCGTETRGDVAGQLSALGIPTVAMAVYRQRALPLSQAALAALRDAGPLIVPLFSPRSARLFADAVPPDLRAGILLAALSPAVAKAGAGISHDRLAVAPQPDAAGMLQAIGDLLDQLDPGCPP